MSWKNYNGLIVENATTLADIEKIVEDLRTEITRFMRETQATAIKTEACLLYDMYTVFDKDLFEENDKERKPLLTATMNNLMESKRDEEDLYESSIGFLHVDGYTLAIPFGTMMKSIRKIVLDHPSIKDFAYWDNTDPPEKDEVSSKEWKLREKLWKKAFGKLVTPKQRMAIYELSDKAVIFPKDSEMENIIPIEEREKSCASRLAMIEVTEAWKEVKPENFNFYKFMQECNKLKNDKYNEFVKGKLDVNLSMRDLEKSIEEKK